MQSYRAFDCTFSSDVPLPELPRSDEPADVQIEIGPVAERSEARLDEQSGVRFYHEPSVSYLAHPHLGRMRITDGDTITIDPIPKADPEAVRQFLVGPGIRDLLTQRGHLVLHASAVVVDGEVVAFVGRRDAGKSTIAAGCYVEGHGVLADDIVVPHFEEGDVRVPPGFPQLKLDRTTADALDIPENTDAGEVYYRYHPVAREFPKEPLSLARIYLVESGSEIGIERIPPGMRIHELLRETYTPYDEDDTDTASEHFEQCAALSKEVPVRKLRRPKTFDELPNLVELIEDDR